MSTKLTCVHQLFQSFWDGSSLIAMSGKNLLMFANFMYLNKRLMSSSLAQVALMIGETELLWVTLTTAEIEWSLHEWLNAYVARLERKIIMYPLTFIGCITCFFVVVQNRTNHFHELGSIHWQWLHQTFQVLNHFLNQYRTLKFTCSIHKFNILIFNSQRYPDTDRR
jgi:hypothetical protein